MHEMSIASNILDLAEKSLVESQQLLSVTVQIGELAGIEIESLRFCFEAIKKSSPFADTQLIIEEIPGQAVCEDCGRTLHITDPFMLCPECQTYSMRITQGQELKLTTIEVE